MDLDQVDEAVDAVVGEGHDAFVAEAENPDEAVLGLHFDGDVEEEVVGREERYRARLSGVR